MRPVVLLAAILGTIAALSLAWSVKPPPPGSLTVVFGDEPRTLDPARTTLVLEQRILQALLEGLTTPDPATLEPRPGAAESWEISPDGLTYTFHIRANAAWSDGRPVTAEDFRWSWMRALAMPEATNRDLFAPIRGVRAWLEKKTGLEQVAIRAAGEKTLVVELERPTAYFLSLTWRVTYLPVRRDAVEAHGEKWTRPGNFVGNGPFVLAAWQPGHRLVAARNPRFHEPVALPAVTFLCVPSGPTTFTLYEGGLARWVSDPPPDLVRDLKGRADLHVVPRQGISFARMAASHAPFDDARVRRAFSLAIDRERIVATKGAGEPPCATFVPPGMAGYKSPPATLRDVDQARIQLAAAGGPGAMPRIRVLFPATKEYRTVALALQAIWAESIGVRVELDGVDRATFGARRRALDYEICLSSWLPEYSDPAAFLEVFASDSANNLTGWSSRAFDVLLRRADAEQGEKRMATLAEAENVLLTTGPVAPYYSLVSLELWDPNLHGISENSLGVHPLAGVSWGK